MQSIFYYVWLEVQPAKRNFETVLKLLGEAEVTEQGKASKLDVHMKFLEESSPLGANHPAVKQYNKCMRGAGDTVRSIIISANSRLAFLENKQVLRLLSKDELNLSDIGIGVNGDGETKGRQGSSSRNYDVLGRELFTPDEVRKLDNKKCIIFIRGFDPIMDNKYIPFRHPMFNQTADGKGKAYVHNTQGADRIIGPPFEILSEKAVKHYEKMKDKGENVYIDTLTYEQFMMLGDAELNR